MLSAAVVLRGADAALDEELEEKLDRDEILVLLLLLEELEELLLLPLDLLDELDLPLPLPRPLDRERDIVRRPTADRLRPERTAGLGEALHFLPGLDDLSLPVAGLRSLLRSLRLCPSLLPA